MIKYLIFLFLTVTSLQLCAQSIEFDIFGNLKFESREQGYSAYLKKDIFDNLIFSDKNNNQLTFNKKYLDLKHPELLKNEEAKIYFFRNLIDVHQSVWKYIATYSVDIFDKIIIEDNRNTKIEIGTDIFGNPTYEEKRNDVEISVKKDLSGNWEYKSGNEKASLKKDIFNKWNYSDSSGNEFEFSEKSWNMLRNRHGSEENIFFYLIHEFFQC